MEPTPLDPSAIQAINADASRLMKHGISRMGDTDEHAVLHALECFDQALALRRQLPVHTDPLLAYGLAACLLNRGDALTRLGGDVHLLEALGAYEEGIDVLRALPLDADPRFRRRLAMAHHNRGLALGARGRASVDLAIAAFSDAIRVLEDDRDAPIPDKPYLLAVAWMNLAQTLLLDDTTEAADRARDAARRALTLVAADETRDLGAAEVGLKARHVCLPGPAAAALRTPESMTRSPTRSIRRPTSWTRGSRSRGRGSRRASPAFATSPTTCFDLARASTGDTSPSSLPSSWATIRTGRSLEQYPSPYSVYISRDPTSNHRSTVVVNT